MRYKYKNRVRSRRIQDYSSLKGQSLPYSVDELDKATLLHISTDNLIVKLYWGTDELCRV